MTNAGVYPPLPTTTVGERHRRRHQSDTLGTFQTSEIAPHASADDDSATARNALNQEEATTEGEGPFPKKIGTNEWLHADGQVYKKLMFVIRKDQSEALDVLLASGNKKLGEDRSEVVRTLLDKANIAGGDASS